MFFVFDGDELIEPDPATTICDSACQTRRRRWLSPAQIKDHKIVAQTVHFHEG